MGIENGQKAPNFSCSADDNTILSLADFKGKNLVIYFYPKDDTPGCTIESQEFTKNYIKFKELNCEIIGVSKDSIESHCRFRDKFSLTFPLLADTEGEMCKAYDVLGEKSMFGKKYIGIIRSTFLLDTNGVLKKIWRDVSVTGHAQEVLDAVKQL